MGGLYKMFVKVEANQLQKILPSIVHGMKYGFFCKRVILHNILNVSLVLDYAKNSRQQVFMIQLYIEKVGARCSVMCYVKWWSYYGDTSGKVNKRRMHTESIINFHYCNTRFVVKIH